MSGSFDNFFNSYYCAMCGAPCGLSYYYIKDPNTQEAIFATYVRVCYDCAKKYNSVLALTITDGTSSALIESCQNKIRPTWNKYFMGFAKLASTRATCDRAQCGCVLVKDHRILATGYNGSPPGEAHCDDVGHLMIDTHCQRTVHAEINAVNQAAKFGVSIDGATAYLTQFPCWNCYKSLITAGISKIYYSGEYRIADNKAYPYNLSLLEKFDE